MKSHPHDLLLQGLASSGKDGPQEIWDHLVGCESCRRRLRSLMHWQAGDAAEKVVPLERRRGAAGKHEPHLLKASRSLQQLASAYDRERAEAIRFFAELEHHPVGQLSLIIRNSVRLQTW